MPGFKLTGKRLARSEDRVIQTTYTDLPGAHVGMHDVDAGFVKNGFSSSKSSLPTKRNKQQGKSVRDRFAFISETGTPHKPHPQIYICVPNIRSEQERRFTTTRWIFRFAKRRSICSENPKLRIPNPSAYRQLSGDGIFPGGLLFWRHGAFSDRQMRYPTRTWK